MTPKQRAAAAARTTNRVLKFLAVFLFASSPVAALACMMTVCGVGVGGGVPAWVPAGAQMYVDFVNNRAWDGITQAVVTPASLLSDTRSAAIPYDPGTGITTTVAANTLPIGSAGLQVFQVNNLLLQTIGDYTTMWATAHGTIAAPTVTKNPDFGSTGCTAADTAPDGSCNTTEVVIPAGTGATNTTSQLQQEITGLTSSTRYTCYFWLKNSATTTNPQFYLEMQQGAAPYTEFAATFVQPGATWQRFSVTGTLPSGQTTLYISMGSNSNSTTGGTSFESPWNPGGTFEAWVSGCSPGAAPAPYVATTTAASPTVALDNITATGDLATALEASAGAVSVTTAGGANGVAGTMLDDNGTVFIGKSTTDAVTTALGAALSSPTVGTYSGAATAYLEWSATAGAISLNGASANTDATSRSPGTGPFHLGTTSGTSAPLNAYVQNLTVYNTARAPVVASSFPITSVSFGTIATISSGTLQGAAPSTYVNGDSWSPAVDGNGDIWTLCDDCGWGTFSGFAGGNVILSEATWSGGNHGYFNLGNYTGGGGGVAGFVNGFNTPLGGQTGKQSGTQNTWKSHGLIAITDGANTDLFAGLTWDAYASSAPWIQVHQTGGSIVSVVNPATAAATTANWSGMPPYSGGILPASPATFTASTFGSPTFIQYPASYCGTGPDGSASYLYAVSNDLAWNTGSNVYLARTPCATILTSLGGSPAAASVAANWQFYDTANAGCSGTGTDNNCWTATLANATSIFILANRLGVTSMSYIPIANRYLLSSWYYPSLNGPTASTQTQAAMAGGTSNFVFADCDKPWHCTAELPEIQWPKQGYYDVALIMSSLSTDSGLTGSMIFAGNFDGSSAFTSAATYTPTLGQITVRY